MQKKGYTYDEALAILRQECPLDLQRFLKFCKECVDQYGQRPDDRYIVAGHLFGLSNQLTVDEAYMKLPMGDIRGIFLNLEVPDAHVNTSRMTVDEQWAELSKIVDKMVDSLNHTSD
jgi:hypothetical protein